jgi:serine/threonine protein kinase
MEQLKPGDPSRVGNYRLIGRLGEGGMGQVFLGLSPGGRQVAVKIIHPGYASSKQFRERFAREIEAARRVGGFHTASVVDADPGADPPWMVTAFIHGPSLQQAVAEGGPFGLERVCRLGAGLAEGLAAIHACGLVHRDLKPSNVILADDGPRIIDFGIARAAEASPMTTAGMVVGTYSYMSPEQLRGEVAGPASDVFALGCMLAFAATARITFGDDSIVTVVYRITTEPPDLSGVTEEHGFRDLVRDCLSKSPANRPSLAPSWNVWPRPAPPPRPSWPIRPPTTGSPSQPLARRPSQPLARRPSQPLARRPSQPLGRRRRRRRAWLPRNRRRTRTWRPGSIPAGRAGHPRLRTCTSPPRPCGPGTGPVPVSPLTSSAPAPMGPSGTSRRAGRPDRRPGQAAPGGGPAAARGARC